MRYLLLALTLILTLTGCKTIEYGELPKSLVLRTRAFEDVVRWGALQKMYIFTRHESGQPVEIPERLDNVRVTSYELASGLTELEPMRWRQTAVIDYVLTDQQVVRRLIDEQVWVSEDEGKTWYRENAPPQFR